SSLSQASATCSVRRHSPYTRLGIAERTIPSPLLHDRTLGDEEFGHLTAKSGPLSRVEFRLRRRGVGVPGLRLGRCRFLDGEDVVARVGGFRSRPFEHRFSCGNETRIRIGSVASCLVVPEIQESDAAVSSDDELPEVAVLGEKRAGDRIHELFLGVDERIEVVDLEVDGGEHWHRTLLSRKLHSAVCTVKCSYVNRRTDGVLVCRPRARRRRGSCPERPDRLTSARSALLDRLAASP